MAFPRRFIPAMPLPKPSPRQQAMAEWRGQHLEAQEQALTRTEKKVGQVMPEVLAKMRLPQRLEETEVLQAWPALVDPTVTAHAQPVGLVKGTLFVKVDSNVWLSEIVRYRHREILKQLQLCFGAQRIKKISFRLG